MSTSAREEPAGVVAARQRASEAGFESSSNLEKVRAALVTHPELIAAELAFSSGIILATKRR